MCHVDNIGVRYTESRIGVRLDAYRRNLVDLQTRLQYGYYKFSKIWPIGFELGPKIFNHFPFVSG